MRLSGKVFKLVKHAKHKWFLFIAAVAIILVMTPCFVSAGIVVRKVLNNGAPKTYTSTNPNDFAVTSGPLQVTAKRFVLYPINEKLVGSSVFLNVQNVSDKTITLMAQNPGNRPLTLTFDNGLILEQGWDAVYTGVTECNRTDAKHCFNAPEKLVPLHPGQFATVTIHAPKSKVDPMGYDASKTAKTCTFQSTFVVGDPTGMYDGTYAIEIEGLPVRNYFGKVTADADEITEKLSYQAGPFELTAEGFSVRNSGARNSYKVSCDFSIKNNSDVPQYVAVFRGGEKTAFVLDSGYVFGLTSNTNPKWNHIKDASSFSSCRNKATPIQPGQTLNVSVEMGASTFGGEQQVASDAKNGSFSTRLYFANQRNEEGSVAVNFSKIPIKSNAFTFGIF